MRVQRQSETFQLKEGRSHISAKDRVIRILREKGYEVYPEGRIYAYVMITDEQGTKLDHIDSIGEYKHPFDIIAYKKSEKSGLSIAYAIEIDGEIHKKKRIAQRDKRNEQILSLFFPDYYIKRIEKVDVISKHITDDNIIKSLDIK